MSELRVDGIHAGYGATPALRGVSFTVAGGEVLAVLGRNGAGKTTTMHTIAGFVAATAGAVSLDSVPLTGLPIHRIARFGVALVPQQRRIFTELSVRENLAVPALRADASRWELVYGLFPKLADRAKQNAGTLSGGEQQMLAIGRALMTDPRVLLLDEPMEGLAPAVVDTVLEAITRLKHAGLAIVLVEQLVPVALSVADTAVIIDRGTVAYTNTAKALAADTDALRIHLGLG